MGEAEAKAGALEMPKPGRVLLFSGEARRMSAVFFQISWFSFLILPGFLQGRERRRLFRLRV